MYLILKPQSASNRISIEQRRGTTSTMCHALLKKAILHYKRAKVPFDLLIAVHIECLKLKFKSLMVSIVYCFMQATYIINCMQDVNNYQASEIRRYKLKQMFSVNKFSFSYHLKIGEKIGAII